ncbi:MAG: hypothetical protein NVS1B11_34310 [Terriglobales bacterium]
MLLTLRMVFEGEGYGVTTAQTGAEALRILGEKCHFDAVVTDLNMEKENIGLDVAQAAIAKRPKPAVVVCTGYASVSNSKASLNMSVDYMAHKPVDLEELISTMTRLMGMRDQRK